MKLSKGKIAVIVVLLVLIIDQVTKIWIKHICIWVNVFP